MKRLAKFLVVIISIVTITGYRNGAYADKNTLVEGVGIPEVVTIGDTKSEIQNRLGRSDEFMHTKYRTKMRSHPLNRQQPRRVTIEKMGHPKNCWYYDSLKLYILFNEHKIVNRIVTTSDMYITKAGLKVGDTRENACNIYNIEKTDSKIIHIPKEGINILFECNFVKELQVYKPY